MTKSSVTCHKGVLPVASGGHSLRQFWQLWWIIELPVILMFRDERERAMKNVLKFVAVAAVAAGLFVTSGSQAVARPKYKDVMSATYAELAKKHGTDGKLTCAVCHPDKDKKIRNNYGAEFGKALTKKNESDEAKIKEALTKAEAGKSATEGKTFGDLIKASELPGTAEAAK
ncbi:MAG: hypothetical protein ACK5TG_00460 [Planctomyces sp.]|jgi:hypothetical protein|nr:hypothetical protein [Planctomycetaceae bacterium]HBC61699.1 hypothetical protein [Planctomycetaceae bacterium]